LSANAKGFTLIELMIVVAIVGILAVLAVYGVRKMTAHAKTAEATNSLGMISQSVVTQAATQGLCRLEKDLSESFEPSGRASSHSRTTCLRRRLDAERRGGRGREAADAALVGLCVRWSPTQ
jgi:prepilin-type N-terminal cleavage/methylation domain-containing protein